MSPEEKYYIRKIVCQLRTCGNEFLSCETPNLRVPNSQRMIFKIKMLGLILKIYMLMRI